MTPFETREIVLPRGGKLHVSMTEEFVQRVRNHFQICDKEPINDQHIRMFFYGALKNAIDGVESAKVR